MKIIYDDLSIDEFFRLGGRVRVNETEVSTVGKFNELRRSEDWNGDTSLDPSNGGDAWIGDQHFRYDNSTFYYRGNLPTTPSKDPYGVPNTNFTLIDEQDCRWEEYQKYRLEHGFDLSELWSLDVAILKFILPRVKALRENFGSYPAMMQEDEWKDILDSIIDALEIALDEDEYEVIDGPKIIKRMYEDRDPGKCKRLLDKYERYRKGMKNLIRYFYQLND